MAICAYCSKEFINHNHSPVKTCSHMCGAKLMWITRPKAIKKVKIYKIRKKGVIINCKFCSKEFYIIQSRFGKALYCSYRCFKKDYIVNNPDWQKKIKHATKERHPMWKGGKSLHSSGYMLIRIEKKYYFEHRIIMEKMINRPLKRQEHVHHIDGDKINNKPENLLLFANAREHANYHILLSGKAHN